MNQKMKRLVATVAFFALILALQGCEGPRPPSLDAPDAANLPGDNSAVWAPDREVDFVVTEDRARFIAVGQLVDVWVPTEVGYERPSQFHGLKVVDVTCDSEACRVRGRSDLPHHRTLNRLSMGPERGPYFFASYRPEEARVSPAFGHLAPDHPRTMQLLRDARFRSRPTSLGKLRTDFRTRDCAFRALGRAPEPYGNEREVQLLPSDFAEEPDLSDDFWIDLYSKGAGEQERLILSRVGFFTRKSVIFTYLTPEELRLVLDHVAAGTLVAHPHRSNPQSAGRPESWREDHVQQQFGEPARTLVERSYAAEVLPALGDVTAEELLADFDWPPPRTNELGIGFAVETSTHDLRGPGRQTRRLIRITARIEHPERVDDVEVRVFFGESVREFDLFGYDDQSRRYGGRQSADGDIHISVGRAADRRGPIPQAADPNLIAVSLGTVEPQTFTILVDADLATPDAAPITVGIGYEDVAKRDAAPIVLGDDGSGSSNTKLWDSKTVEVARVPSFAEATLDHRFASLLGVLAEVLHGSLPTLDLRFPAPQDLLTSADRDDLGPERRSILPAVNWFWSQLSCTPSALLEP